MADETPGRIAYERFCEHPAARYLLHGTEKIIWDELPKDIKEAWEDAASAVIMGVDI
jgi:hypothetical protein